MNPILRIGTLLVALLLLCPLPALAQFVTLHTFGDSSVPNDGAYPGGGFATGYDGTLYATTGNGGSKNAGCVYHMTREGQVTILHSFLDGSVPHDGYGPGALVFNRKDGYFYGLTTYGGTTSTILAGYGTFYKMSKSGQVTILHNFGDGSVADDAIYPSSMILDTDGNFIGTASSDRIGSTRPAGVAEGLIFRVTTTGKVTIMHYFGKYGSRADGASPSGIMQAADGDFYGTTAYGGSVDLDGNGLGTIFKMTHAGVVTTLHSFNGADGGVPQGGLVQSSKGIFYGTTEVGGADSYGTVYQMTPDFVVTALHSFGDGTTANDGLQPFCTLAQAWNGNLFGTTGFGGAAGSGTAFKITPAGQLTILHSFGVDPNDGANPFSGLTFVFDGYLYGTATMGGTANLGTVFKFPYAFLPPPPVISVN